MPTSAVVEGGAFRRPNLRHCRTLLLPSALAYNCCSIDSAISEDVAYGVNIPSANIAVLHLTDRD